MKNIKSSINVIKSGVGNIGSELRVIDEGIILRFSGPESYTGEDMAEFHIHN
mgnify:FL=1